MTSEALAREFVFGPSARALNARALPISTPGVLLAENSLADRIAFAFDMQGMPSSERAEWQSLEDTWLAPQARFGEDPGFRLASHLLVTRSSILMDQARRLPSANCFLAAQRNLETPPGRPQMMGVLNVTPDSFSDGGETLDPALALARAEQMAHEGAEWIDIGGESSRPGSDPVSLDEELRRVLPVIAAVAERVDVPISIDTTKAEVARRAIERGAKMVNDISGGTQEPEILEVCAEHGVQYCCMHMRGKPKTMQEEVHYDDPTAEISRWLRRAVERCLKAGLPLNKIVLDPGIGFGKRLVDNLDVLRRLPELRSLGRPLLLGVSRKSFIGHLAAAQGTTNSDDQGAPAAPSHRPADRLGGTASAIVACIRGGAEILRVHDVAVMHEASLVATALYRPDLRP